MKTYRFVTLYDDDITPRYYTITEDEILAGYDSWVKKQKINDKTEINISKEYYLHQWIRENYAWEITNERT